MLRVERSPCKAGESCSGAETAAARNDSQPRHPHIAALAARGCRGVAAPGQRRAAQCHATVRRRPCTAAAPRTTRSWPPRVRCKAMQASVCGVWWWRLTCRTTLAVRRRGCALTSDHPPPSERACHPGLPCAAPWPSRLPPRIHSAGRPACSLPRAGSGPFSALRGWAGPPCWQPAPRRRQAAGPWLRHPSRSAQEACARAGQRWARPWPPLCLQTRGWHSVCGVGAGGRRVGGGRGERGEEVQLQRSCRLPARLLPRCAAAWPAARRLHGAPCTGCSRTLLGDRPSAALARNSRGAGPTGNWGRGQQQQHLALPGQRPERREWAREPVT